MFFKSKKTVYIVAGYIWEEDGHAYPMVSEHAVFSTRGKAMKELREIAKEARNEAKEMEYEIKLEYKSDFDTLEIIYPETGTIENWVIYERGIE